MVILRSSVAWFSKRTPFLSQPIEVEKPRGYFKCKTNSCRMPKYKLYRLYFHFITFQITTNALVLAQPSNSDQTLYQLHFKVQIRFATKEPPSPLYIGG